MQVQGGEVDGAGKGIGIGSSQIEVGCNEKSSVTPH